MKKCEITVYGLVQGIGYRPFVAELAERLGISGDVRNSGGIVIINAYGQEWNVDDFIRRLRDDAPEGARVEKISVRDLELSGPEIGAGLSSAGFSIIGSTSHSEDIRLLPPDLPTCASCERDLLDPGNRRYRYPFISCAACGPRFSIMTGVPYDRRSTTMSRFRMCSACRKEYEEPGNIRRYAQTISCHDCGPVLKYVEYHAGENSFFELSGEAALEKGIAEIKKGKIAAIKDIGGFHFAFLPTVSEPGARLREFKDRETKPFAVMFPDLDSIREYCNILPEEEKLLRSEPRPIVLLKKRLGPDRKPLKDFAPEVCGESDMIGAMLPCDPLQILILRETGPLVMTSGNPGGEPIIIYDDPVRELMTSGCPDFMLTHDREILTPLDDSIFQVVNIHLKDGSDRRMPQIVRRARGIVPEPVFLPVELKKETFAAGGDLKNVFALGKGRAVYMSGHFGDLVSVESSNQRDKAVKHMENLLDVHPEEAAADRHPSYASSKDTAARFGRDHTFLYQHHYAHVASVIAEHGIKGAVIGVAFDGTGYGDDGAIWGSEFFLCDPENELRIEYTADPEKKKIQHVIPVNDIADEKENKKEPEKKVRVGRYIRMGHLMPVKMLGGDESARNAARTFNCYMKDAEDRQLIWEHYSEDEILDPDMHQLIEIAIAAGINTYTTTSMGRLFDAAAAVLGICSYNSYESECPQKLEAAARRAELKWRSGVYTADNPLNGRYPVRFILSRSNDEWNADGARLIGDLRMALDGGVPVDELALEFHDAVAEMTVTIVEKIAWEAGENGILTHRVALSGGTFLNRILLQRVVSGLTERGFEVYVNEKVPAGDGGLALGQMYLAALDE